MEKWWKTFIYHISYIIFHFNLTSSFYFFLVLFSCVVVVISLCCCFLASGIFFSFFFTTKGSFSLYIFSIILIKFSTGKIFLVMKEVGFYFYFLLLYFSNPRKTYPYYRLKENFPFFLQFSNPPHPKLNPHPNPPFTYNAFYIF